MSSRASSEWLIDVALSSGAQLTGTPDGVAPVTVSFSPKAWRRFAEVVAGSVNSVADHPLTANPAADAANMRQEARLLREAESPALGVAPPPVAVYIGVLFSGDYTKEGFWYIECPCGVVATYPVNGLPEADTPHPCGNPNHWTVRYSTDSMGEDHAAG